MFFRALQRARQKDGKKAICVIEDCERIMEEDNKQRLRCAVESLWTIPTRNLADLFITFSEQAPCRHFNKRN